MKDIVTLSVAKFTNSIMERIRCLKLQGKTFENEIPSRHDVEKVVLSYIEDETKFRELFRPTTMDPIHSSSDALFLAQPLNCAELIDEYFTGDYKRDEEYDDSIPYTLELMITNLISNSLEIASCLCHNKWDKDDKPSDVEFFVEKMRERGRID